MRPNILLIITHDTGRHLGCYGRPVCSPAIDRMAGEGVRFERYFVCAPQCSPSRAAITSGHYPHKTGMLGLLGYGGWRMGDDCPTLAKALGAAGYDTWLWGFQHEHEDPFRLGYRHDPIAYRRGEVPKILADRVTPHFCAWLETKPAEPWFASVGFYETHLPWPKNDAAALETAVPPYLPDLSELRRDMGEFQESLNRVDCAVGHIIDTLDRTGMAQRTLVIFTTDHGLPLPRAKCTLYDPGIEAALIMRWPAVIPPNRVCSELLSATDLMPTLLEIVGVKNPKGVDGRSFTALLTGGRYVPRREIFAEQTWHDAYAPLRAIRTDRYKLIRRFAAMPANLLPKDFYKCCHASEKLRQLLANTLLPDWEAYDLAADPLETRNLASNNPEAQAELAQLVARLKEWMQESGDPLLNGPVACPEPFLGI